MDEEKRRDLGIETMVVRVGEIWGLATVMWEHVMAKLPHMLNLRRCIQFHHSLATDDDARKQHLTVWQLRKILAGLQKEFSILHRKHC